MHSRHVTPYVNQTSIWGNGWTWKQYQRVIFSAVDTVMLYPRTPVGGAHSAHSQQSWLTMAQSPVPQNSELSVQRSCLSPDNTFPGRVYIILAVNLWGNAHTCLSSLNSRQQKKVPTWVLPSGSAEIYVASIIVSLSAFPILFLLYLYLSSSKSSSKIANSVLCFRLPKWRHRVNGFL